MATSQSTNEMVSKAQTGRAGPSLPGGNDLAAALDWLENHIYLERRQYCYLGEDAEGQHHHLDECEDTVYVTDRTFERFRPADSALDHWRITGELEHVEDLDAYEDLRVADWIAWVSDVSGWRNKAATVIDGGDLGECLDGGSR